MEFKKLMSAALMLGAISFGASTASAESVWLPILNGNLGTNFTNCIVCHGTAANLPKNKGVTAIAGTQGNVTATTDSDGDGFTDIQEVNGTAMNFNSAAVTPFTLAAGVEGITLNAAINVIELNSGNAPITETAVTDAYANFAITVPSGSEVVKDIYASATASSTFTYRVGIPTGSTTYTVDKVAGTNTDVTAGTTINANGSITTTAGAADLVVVRVTPATGGGASSSGGGCITASVTTPLMMFLLMLTLGFVVRRKKD